MDNDEKDLGVNIIAWTRGATECMITALEAEDYDLAVYAGFEIQRMFDEGLIGQSLKILALCHNEELRVKTPDELADSPHWHRICTAFDKHMVGYTPVLPSCENPS